MSNMSSRQLSGPPSAGTVLRVLHEGYWDRLELIRASDGTLRVRKVSHGTKCAGPWALSTLRQEIKYLKALRGDVVDYFPKLLCDWDDSSGLGYEMSYVPDAVNAGNLAGSGRSDQVQADALQERLAEVLFDFVHEPAAASKPLSVHVRQVIDETLGQLARYSEFSELIDAPAIKINGKRLAGARIAMKQFVESKSEPARIDHSPVVRLHGDFFLQNVVLTDTGLRGNWPSGLTLVDPVSVAGVCEGHPLFDLVKYESYATGELPALRSGRIEVDGFDDPSQRTYMYGVAFEAPEIRPFRQIDWRSRFRERFTLRYGPIHMPAYHLLDAYFALVMAMCTDGLQRRARVLKGVLALNAAISGNG